MVTMFFFGSRVPSSYYETLFNNLNSERKKWKNLNQFSFIIKRVTKNYSS